jgi:hypothetical protein
MKRHTLHLDADLGNLDAIRAVVEAVEDASEQAALVNRKHTGDSATGFNRGSTALMYACRSGHERVVGYLLEHGADVRAVDAENWAALHYACFNGHAGVVALLLPHNPDTGLVTTYERATPTGFALHRRFADCVRLLGSTEVECAAAEVPFGAKEKQQALAKASEKFERGLRAVPSGEPGRFLFRYGVDQSAISQIRGFLRGKAERVQIHANDTLGDAGCIIIMNAAFSLHRAEALVLRAHVASTVRRVSSINGCQHIIVCEVPGAAVNEALPS